MKKLKTKLGILYYENSKEDSFEYVLLDSNKNFLSNIYHKDSLKAIKKCDEIYTLFADILGEYVACAKSIDDLLVLVNNTIEFENKIYGYKDNLLTLEDLKDNLNIIGNNYIYITRQ